MSNKVQLKIQKERIRYNKDITVEFDNRKGPINSEIEKNENF